MKRLLISGLIIVGFLQTGSWVYSQEPTSNDAVSATVKTNICGDGQVEEPAEDCEGADLNGQTCVSLGYGGGSLSCDAACEFVVSDCVAASPSPTTSGNKNEETTATETKTSVSSVVSTIVQSVTAPLRDRLMPSGLAKFDSDNSGRLEVSEMRVAVRQWVEGWRKVAAARLGSLPREEQERLMEPDKEGGMTKLIALLNNEGGGADSQAATEKIEPEEAGALRIFTNTVEVEEENLGVCDINDDRDCNLIDLSIILYFIGR